MILALAASLFSFAVDNAVDPYARQRERELVAVAARRHVVAGHPGRHFPQDRGRAVHADRRATSGRPARRHLRRRFCATKASTSIYYAKTGAVIERDGKNVLMMNDGDIHRKASERRSLGHPLHILCVRLVGVLRQHVGQPHVCSEGPDASRICSIPIPTTSSTSKPRNRFGQRCTDDYPNGSIPLLSR